MAEGSYIRADTGASIDGSADIGADAPVGGEASYQDGSLLSPGIGYANSSAWRFESEFSGRHSDLGAAPLLDPGGSVEVTAFMANLCRDFGDGGIRPYVGLGLGYAQTEMQATLAPPLVSLVVDDDDARLAYQVMRGGSADVGAHARVDFGCRYFAAPGFEGIGTTPPAATFSVEADFDEHALVADLRWSF